MKEFQFSKMVASGNDFVVARLQAGDSALRDLARAVCARQLGIGADGLLVLEGSSRADIRMRVFNADGSEAEMCGNGARCVSLWLALQRKTRKNSFRIETRAGLIASEVNGNQIKIRLTQPRDLKLDMPLRLKGRMIRVHFINTGVPHTVIFVHGLDRMDVQELGRQIRTHKAFAPKGTNVNFVQVQDARTLQLRTYERGVEAETLACGTGSVASACIASLKYGSQGNSILKVQTQSKEVLKVYLRREDLHIEEVWLEGRARIICKGVCYV